MFESFTNMTQIINCSRNIGLNVITYACFQRRDVSIDNAKDRKATLRCDVRNGRLALMKTDFLCLRSTRRLLFKHKMIHETFFNRFQNDGQKYSAFVRSKKNIAALEVELALEQAFWISCFPKPVFHSNKMPLPFS